MGEKKMEKLVLKTPEAMKYLGYGSTKFKKILREGKIRGYKDGRWFFPIEELEAYRKRMMKLTSGR